VSCAKEFAPSFAAQLPDGLKMIARISVRAALLAAVVATIGCDRVSKHIATATLAGEPGRSYLG